MQGEAAAHEPLADAYARALHDYVAGAGEAALARAYALGRAAAGGGGGILDLVVLHHAAVARLGAPSGPALEMAGLFLAECLSPFEMALRSFQANARLLGLSQTLAQQNAEMAHARAQLQTILDATTALVYLKDAGGRYLFVNRQFEAAFGLAPGGALGRSDDELLPPEVAAMLATDDRAALAAGTPQEVEELLATPDGPHTYIALKVPLLDPGGAPYGLCCVATDFTERKRAAEAQQRAQEAAARERQLEEAIQRRDEFLTVATHELSTPLTALRLQVEGLGRLAAASGDAPPSAARVRAKCESITRQLERLALLVESLVDTGKVRVGALPLAREPVDLAELVRAIVARSADPIRRAGSEVTVRGAPAAVGRWDRRLLENAVSSVVLNAVKFGQGKPIEIELACAAGGARLSVRDHGIGIPPQDQERIFQRFGRAVSELHYGGFGVSLWAARQVVEAHGGRIRVSSAPGAGAEFTLELPLDGA